ncbi:MAG: hypothetical protein WBG43_02785, partial [Marinifilaceae bacterium]
RAKLLFTAFLKKQAFVFKGVDVMINKICHDDGSGNSLLVYGTTGSNNENVEFYYNIKTVNEHWNTAPTSTITKEFTSYDLIDKFIKRQNILNHVFNKIETTTASNQFELSGIPGSTDVSKTMVSITNQLVNLDNITLNRAKLLFTSFLKKQAFVFKGVDVMINKICHEDGSGNSFLVYGTTGSNSKNVVFYYNTRTNEEHWN